MSIRTDIIAKAAAAFDVHPRDLARDFRYTFLTRARFAMYLALHQRGWGDAKIGRAVGRDRKSVTHGVARAKYMVEHDPDFAAKVAELTDTLVASNALWVATTGDIFDFVCRAASKDPSLVLRLRAFDPFSKMLTALAMRVATDAGISNRKVGAFFGIDGSTARRAAMKFEETWGAYDAAMDILTRARAEFSRQGVAIADCACDDAAATTRKAA